MAQKLANGTQVLMKDGKRATVKSNAGGGDYVVERAEDKKRFAVSGSTLTEVTVTRGTGVVLKGTDEEE